MEEITSKLKEYIHDNESFKNILDAINELPIIFNKKNKYTIYNVDLSEEDTKELYTHLNDISLNFLKESSVYKIDDNLINNLIKIEVPKKDTVLTNIALYEKLKKTVNDKIIYELIVEISDYLKVCNEMMEDKINSYSKNIEDKKQTKIKSLKRLTEN